jgi:hypothetical protein
LPPEGLRTQPRVSTLGTLKINGSPSQGTTPLMLVGEKKRNKFEDENEHEHEHD